MTSADVRTALVLTAGRGTRLRLLSLLRAKPALPVVGEPLARRILRWLARQGVQDALLNLHHRPETVTAAVGDGSDLGVRVRYSWEPRLLGSAGGPRHALALLDAPRFWIVNGDTLHAMDLAPMARTHADRAALVTMALVANRRPDRYGGVLVRDGWITGFTPPGSSVPSWHFIGVQIAEADTFATLPDDEPAESVSGLYRTLVGPGRSRVAAFISEAPFRDIGTPADYLATSLSVAREEGFGDALPPGTGTRIHRSARVERSVIWDEVTIGADVELTECVVADRASIPAGLRLERRIVVPAGAIDVAEGAERVEDLWVAPLD